MNLIVLLLCLIKALSNEMAIKLTLVENLQKLIPGPLLTKQINSLIIKLSASSAIFLPIYVFS
jgi:hypothetical protein